MVKTQPIEIPNDIIKYITNLMSKIKELSYENPREFIIEAIRRRLEDFLVLKIKSEPEENKEPIILDYL